MKAISLLLLRLSTGLLLILWGMPRILTPERGIGLSDTYYKGLLNSETIQQGIGIAEVALGVLVILGFLRIIVYPIQAIVLGLGAGFIADRIANQVTGLFGIDLLAEPGRFDLLFFPSTTVFFATLVLLAFKEYDTISIDGMRGR